MSRARSPLVVALVLVLDLLLSSPPLAHATSCAAPELGPSTTHADVVFVATVVASRQNSVYSLSVQRVFKGEVPRSVKVLGGGMKGASFENGKRFLVFARLQLTQGPDDPPLFAHLCGGTQLAEQAKDWLAQLGTGSAPGQLLTSGNSPPPAPDAGPTPTASSASPAPASPSSSSAPVPASASASPPPAPSPAPAATPPDGGCAACSVGSPATDSRLPFGALALAALVATRQARNGRRQRARRSILGP